ncbi:hypothetical protein SAMD00019534_082460, partial [Acytostelium subglobosum LB1]|uniref:hypothetical protein n=1 Tax=Acytostelium subglobosum LB1 TaxID=1410327 RepID=UPI000644D283
PPDTVLPNNLTSLTFGNRFNQLIMPGALPSSLEQLTFGSAYNQLIELGLFHEGLTSLEFGSSFDQEIPVGGLPVSLRSLTFGMMFNRSIYLQVLPPALTYLALGDTYNHTFTPDQLPESIATLKVGRASIQPNAFPRSLTSLSYGLSVTFTQHFPKGFLPPTLLSLSIGFNYYYPLPPGSLPDSLTELRFLSGMDQPNDNVTLPANLTKLSLLSTHQCKYIQDHPHSIDHVTIVGSHDMDYPGDKAWMTKPVRLMTLTVYADHHRDKALSKELVLLLRRLYVNYPAVETFEIFVQDTNNHNMMLIKCRMIDVVKKRVVYTVRELEQTPSSPSSSSLDKPVLHLGFISLNTGSSITKQFLSFVRRF